MRLLTIAVLLVVTGCASTGDVRAHDGAGHIPERFYNRPGASGGELALELQRCESIVTGPQGSTVEQRPLAPAPSTPSDSLVAVIGGAGTLEDCMVARGWRVFALSAQESAEWNASTKEVRDEELAVLVGAVHPAKGRMVRAEKSLQLRKP